MKSILIVEDDEDVRESLADLLTLRGYHVIAAVNGREALDRLEAGLRPCLIVLDLMLPVMSGWEFRRRQLANDHWAGIPTILLSGIDHLARETQRLRAVGFLPKPIDVQSLYNTVAHFC